MHGNTAPAAPAASSEPEAKRKKKEPTTFPDAPTDGKRIAVWIGGLYAPGAGGWLTGTVTTTAATATLSTGQTTWWTHRDGVTRTFDPTAEDWQYYIAATSCKPACPACGSLATKVCGGGNKRKGSKAYSTEYYHVCCACAQRMRSQHPAYLERRDRASPKPTEALTVTRDDKSGPVRQTPPAPPPPPLPPHRYRAGAAEHACIGDTTLLYTNQQNLGAPGAARAFIRDVALHHSDITSISEAGNNAPQITALQSHFAAQKHRVMRAPRTRLRCQNANAA